MCAYTKTKGGVMGSLIDLSGRLFGRLTVTARVGTSGNEPTWHCVCACGAERVVRGQGLRSGTTKSCGCLSVEMSRGRRGASHPRYRADDVTYVGAHRRVFRWRGEAGDYPCVDCGGTAEDWCLRKEAENAKVSTRPRNRGLRYSSNPDDYDPRCKVCHWAYDRRGGQPACL